MDISNKRIDMNDISSTSIDTSSKVNTGFNDKAKTFGEFFNGLSEDYQNSKDESTTTSSNEVDDFDLSSFADESSSSSTISDLVSNIGNDIKLFQQKVEVFFKNLGSSIVNTGADIATTIKSKVESLFKATKENTDANSTDELYIGDNEVEQLDEVSQTETQYSDNIIPEVEVPIIDELDDIDINDDAAVSIESDVEEISKPFSWDTMYNYDFVQDVSLKIGGSEVVVPALDFSKRDGNIYTYDAERVVDEVGKPIMNSTKVTDSESGITYTITTPTEAKENLKVIFYVRGKGGVSSSYTNYINKGYAGDDFIFVDVENINNDPPSGEKLNILLEKIMEQCGATDAITLFTSKSSSGYSGPQLYKLDQERENPFIKKIFTVDGSISEFVDVDAETGAKIYPDIPIFVASSTEDPEVLTSNQNAHVNYNPKSQIQLAEEFNENGGNVQFALILNDIDENKVYSERDKSGPEHGQIAANITCIEDFIPFMLEDGNVEAVPESIKTEEEILDEVGDVPDINSMAESSSEETVYDRNKILTEAEMAKVKDEATSLANNVLAQMESIITLGNVTVLENGNVMIEFNSPQQGPWMKIIYNVNDPSTLENITTFITGDSGYRVMTDHVVKPLLSDVNDFAFVAVSPHNEDEIKECSDVSMNMLNALADKYNITFKYAELSGWSQGAYGTGVFFDSLERILNNVQDIDINLRLYGAWDNGKYLAGYLNRNPNVLEKMINTRTVVYMYEEYGDGNGGTDNVRTQLGKFVDQGLLVVEARNHRLRAHDEFVLADKFRIAEGENIKNKFEAETLNHDDTYSDNMIYHLDVGLDGGKIGKKRLISLQELASLVSEYKNSKGSGIELEEPTAVQVDSEIESDVETSTATDLDAHVEQPTVDTRAKVQDLSTKAMTATWDAGYSIDYDYVAANGTKCIVIKKNGVEINDDSLMYVSLPDGLHNHSIKEAYSDYLVTLAKKNTDFFHDVIVIPTGDYVANAKNVNKYRDAVNEIADSLGVNHYVVAGESAGGDTAVQWAIMYPNDERLVAVDAIANSGITMGSNTQGRGLGNATPEQKQALADSHIKVRIFPLKYNSGTIFDKWIDDYHPQNVVMATDSEGRPRYFADGNGKAVAYTDSYFYAPHDYVDSIKI